MTVPKPTLPPYNPGEPVLYEVTNVDWNQQVLQQGARTQLLIEPVTAFPASPAVGDWCFRSDVGTIYICTNATGPVWTPIGLGPNAVIDNNLGIGGGASANVQVTMGGTIAAAVASVSGLIQAGLTLKPMASGGNQTFLGAGGAVDTSSAGGAVAGAFGLLISAITKTGANALNFAYGIFVSIPTGGTSNTGLAFDTPAGAIAQEAITAPTLTNSWVNFGSGNMSAGYYRDTQGEVHVQGTVSGGTIGTAGTFSGSSGGSSQIGDAANQDTITVYEVLVFSAPLTPTDHAYVLDNLNRNYLLY